MSSSDSENNLNNKFNRALTLGSIYIRTFQENIKNVIKPSETRDLKVRAT